MFLLTHRERAGQVASDERIDEQAQLGRRLGDLDDVLLRRDGGDREKGESCARGVVRSGRT